MNNEGYQKLVDDILSAPGNAEFVATYNSGHKGILSKFIGQAMSYSNGAANKEILEKVFKEKLERIHDVNSMFSVMYKHD